VQPVPDTAAAARPLAKRAPDFFIVGHEKCGTTALYEMLRRHPQIFMPDRKEPRFFATDMGARFTLGRGGLPQTLDEYLALFATARSDQLAGEATPHYLRSTVAATRIAEVQPAARIVAIVREPAAYLRSFHLQNVQNRIEPQKDFRKAVMLEGARRQGRRIPRRCESPPALLYSDHVRYVEQLRRYYDVFGPEQVLVLIYDDFRNDNPGTVRRVLRFLGVDDTAPLEPVETNRLKAVRFRHLHELAAAARFARRHPDRASRSAKAFNALIPQPLRSEAFRRRWRRTVYATPAPPDEQWMVQLRRRFKPEVVALSEFLDRDLVELWGYRDLQ
jgi:Sulfotransferase family